MVAHLRQLELNFGDGSVQDAYLDEQPECICILVAVITKLADLWETKHEILHTSMLGNLRPSLAMWYFSMIEVSGRRSQRPESYNFWKFELTRKMSV